MRRTVLVPLLALMFLHIVVLFAGFFAPYGPVAQYRLLAFAPPTRLHFVDARGNHSWRPFVYRRRAEPAGLYEEDRSRPLLP